MVGPEWGPEASWTSMGIAESPAALEVKGRDLREKKKFLNKKFLTIVLNQNETEEKTQTKSTKIRYKRLMRNRKTSLSRKCKLCSCSLTLTIIQGEKA